MISNDLFDNLKDENNEFKIEIDNLKRDRKVLINSIEQMANLARSQLHNFEKTLDLFRIFNQKIKCVPPLDYKSPEENNEGSKKGNLND